MIQILKSFLDAKWRWLSLRDREALEHYQNKRIQSMIKFVNEGSSFYHEHWKHHDLSNFQHLPQVNKSLMMSHFDQFNTAGIHYAQALKVAMQAEQDRNFQMFNGYTIGLSSGTSGERGLFLVSQKEQDIWTGVMLARALHSIKVSGEKIAFFLRSNSNLYENLGRGKYLQFRYFDLKQHTSNIVKNLNQFEPTIIVAPPSLLETLWLEQENGRLLIHPQRLISVAEVLEPQDKQRLEHGFRVPVHQIYQATEGLLAISCKAGSLHIQEDLVKLEFETLEDEYVTPIITDLWRRTQPIIRYRLGDVLRLEKDTCPCQHPWRVIKQIEGRERDILEFSGKKLFPDQWRKTILQTSGIKDYRVLQDSQDLQICLEVEKDFANVAKQVEQHINQMFHAQGINYKKLEVIHGLPARESHIKRRRIIRK